jgi:hypothetical protein
MTDRTPPTFADMVSAMRASISDGALPAIFDNDSGEPASRAEQERAAAAFATHAIMVGCAHDGCTAEIEMDAADAAGWKLIPCDEPDEHEIEGESGHLHPACPACLRAIHGQ